MHRGSTCPSANQMAVRTCRRSATEVCAGVSACVLGDHYAGRRPHPGPTVPPYSVTLLKVAPSGRSSCFWLHFCTASRGSGSKLVPALQGRRPWGMTCCDGSSPHSTSTTIRCWSEKSGSSSGVAGRASSRTVAGKSYASAGATFFASATRTTTAALARTSG